MTFYTEAGLIKLATIIRTARQHRDMSLRDFASLVGVTHKTIDRLESCRFKDPSNETLSKLAPHVGYALEELIAIASCKVITAPRQTVEDILPLLSNLPTSELERLLEITKIRLESSQVLEKNFIESP